MDDGAEVQLLRRHTGEAFPQVVTSLRAEDRDRARARAIGSRFTMVEDVLEEFVILAHQRE